MKLKSLALAAAMSSLTFAAFGNDDQIKVRLINALPQSQGITVSIGEKQFFTSIQSGQITPFKTLPKMDDDQKITIQHGQQQLQTEESFSLDNDDENYTILVTQDEDNTNPKVVLLDEDDDAVDQDEVELTVINAAPEHSSVKLRLNDDTKARGINYSESEDEDVSPGQYNLSLLNATGSDSVIAQKSVSLRGGTAVTVLLTSPNNMKIIDNNSPDQDLAVGGNAQAIDRPSTGTQQTTGTAPAMMNTGTNNMNTRTPGDPSNAQNSVVPSGATAAPQTPSNMTTPAMNLM